MQVKCIDAGRFKKTLSENKIYIATKQSGQSYYICGNTGTYYWFPKKLFEEVKPEQIKRYVRCIDDFGCPKLTNNKDYEVIEIDDLWTMVIDDSQNNSLYFSCRFMEIKPKLLTDFKVGDTVKVLRAGDLNRGYVDSTMNKYIGQEFIVTELDYKPGNERVRLSCGWIFETDTLELVKRKEDNMNYTNDTAAKQMVKERRWIVGSIDANGNFSISSSPMGHPSQAAAKTEAKRLANVNNTKTFIVMQLQAGYKVSAVEEI